MMSGEWGPSCGLLCSPWHHTGRRTHFWLWKTFQRPRLGYRWVRLCVCVCVFVLRACVQWRERRGMRWREHIYTHTSMNWLTPIPRQSITHHTVSQSHEHLTLDISSPCSLHGLSHFNDLFVTLILSYHILFFLLSRDWNRRRGYGTEGVLQQQIY